MGQAANYCIDCAKSSTRLSGDAERETLYLEWLDGHSRALLKAVDSELTPRSWEIFDIAMFEFAGLFDPSVYASFGCKSAKTLSPHLRTLERSGVVASFRDESDKRRKTIQVTPKGHLVHYARQDPMARLALEELESP